MAKEVEEKKTKKTAKTTEKKAEKKVVEQDETSIEELKAENEKLKQEKAEQIKKEEKAEKKELFNKVWNFFWWIVLIIWMLFCLIDFFNVHAEKDPIFCFGKTTTTYTAEDETSSKYGTGTVTYCYGLGYKVYHYNRSNYKALEFSPFWTKDRTSILDTEDTTE